MEKPDHESRVTDSSKAPQQRQDALAGARALFESMAGEARLRSELERQEGRGRGRVARLLLALTIAACLLAAATGIYGAYNFPDAPIRQVEGVYVGKGGKTHAREDFEAFILWKKVMFIVFPSAFALGLAFAVTEAGRRRKRTS